MITRYIIKIEHLYLDLQFEKEIHVYIKILVYLNSLDKSKNLR